MGKLESRTKFWSENLKGKPLGRPMHKWENNITMDLREIGCVSVDWKHLAQDRA
jgi:hypothetical protein